MLNWTLNLHTCPRLSEKTSCTVNPCAEFQSLSLQYRLRAVFLKRMITILINSVFLGFSCAALPYLPLRYLLTLLISRKVDTTVGCWCLKSWQEKPSEAYPIRKTLTGHPGEPAGSCLRHYPPVSYNALKDTGLYRVQVLCVSHSFFLFFAVLM